VAETITVEQLRQKLAQDDKPTVVEVLAPAEYRRAHIPGAVNIPYRRIAGEAKKRFQPEAEIVVYCSDTHCTASEIAAQKLTSAGYSNVYHFKGGKEAWQRAGLPLDSLP
jgi:rhodanese-related sulfurtransferase